MNSQIPSSTSVTPVTLLGLGSMGTALARAWLAAGRPLTVWNRNRARADSLAEAHADSDVAVAATAAEAVAAGRLVVVCLLDDASVDEVLSGVDLAGKDVVNLTTSSPGQARARARDVAERGGRFLDGGIMAVPAMIGAPGSGAFTFYSGAPEVFEAHRTVLGIPSDATYVGDDPGFASLFDVALLSAMYGLFGGLTHAFALIRDEDVAAPEFAEMLVPFLVAMTGSARQTAEQLHSDAAHPQTSDSGIAMQVAGVPTFLRTAEEQRTSGELILPYLKLMERSLREGRAHEGPRGLVELLAAPADGS